LVPPPEVDVKTVDPVAFEVTQSSGGSAEMVTIELEIANNVTALLKQIQVQYFDADGERTIAPSASPLPMDVELGYNETTQTPILVEISDIPVIVSSELITWMYANDSNATARLVCTGVDAFEREMEWDAHIDVGIYATDL
jgi:hypothetical protein